MEDGIFIERAVLHVTVDISGSSATTTKQWQAISMTYERLLKSTAATGGSHVSSVCNPVLSIYVIKSPFKCVKSNHNHDAHQTDDNVVFHPESIISSDQNSPSLWHKVNHISAHCPINVDKSKEGIIVTCDDGIKSTIWPHYRPYKS